MPAIIKGSQESVTDLSAEEAHFAEMLRLTHIVNPPMNPDIWDGSMEMTGQDVVDIARTEGLEVVALCGYKWVPKHNPDKYDICSTCLDIANQLIGRHG